MNFVYNGSVYTGPPQLNRAIQYIRTVLSPEWALNRSDLRLSIGRSPKGGAGGAGVEMYTAATRVTVWLGDAGECTDLAFDQVPSLCSKPAAIGDVSEVLFSKGLGRQGLAKDNDAVWAVLVNTYNRAWFRRLGSIRSCISDGSIVLCGLNTLQWEL